MLRTRQNPICLHLMLTLLFNTVLIEYKISKGARVNSGSFSFKDSYLKSILEIW